MERQFAVLNIRKRIEICDVAEFNSFELLDKFSHALHLSDHHDVATTKELFTEYTRNDTGTSDELAKTDHRLQQQEGIKSSNLSDISDEVAEYLTFISDEIADESDNTECVSSQRSNTRHVLCRSHSSVEYSSCDTVGNITASVISQDEIHKSITTSDACQDEMFNNLTQVASQREILKTVLLMTPQTETLETKIATLSQNDILKSLTPIFPEKELFKNTRTSLIYEDDVVKLIKTATITPKEIIKVTSTSNISHDDTHTIMTTSPISQFDMLQGSASPDLPTEHAFFEHCYYEGPHSLLKSFTKQLSITRVLQLDEVSVDGVDEDNHKENSTQMCTRGFNETSKLQKTYIAELLERGQCEQHTEPGRSTPVTAYISQSAQSSGLNCLSSIAGYRISGSSQPVPRSHQPLLATGIPQELRSIRDSPNQFFLQMTPPATCFNPSSNAADVPEFYPSSSRPPGHIKSSSESSNEVPATPSSSSSFLIRGAEGDLSVAKRTPAAKGGHRNCQNEPSQWHEDVWRHTQTNVHAGGNSCSNLSQQRSEQTQQQCVPKTHSHAEQYNYFYDNPVYNQQKMLNSRLYKEMYSYEKPGPYLPDFSKLSNAYDIEETRQTPSIAHEFGCTQKYYPLHVNPQCRTPDSFCSSAKVGSYEIPGGLYLHQTNQQRFSNHSIPCANRSQPNARLSTGKSSTTGGRPSHRRQNPPVKTRPSTCESSTAVDPLQSRHIQLTEAEPSANKSSAAAVGQSQSKQNQSVDEGNRCLVQNPHIMHGEYQLPLNYEIILQQNLHSRNKKSDSRLQQSSKNKHDCFSHSSSQVIREAQIAGTSQNCHWRADKGPPQLNKITTRVNKCVEWLCDGGFKGDNRRLLDNNNHGGNIRPFGHNSSKEYNAQPTVQATKRDELAARPTHALPEHLNLPRGLFDGQPLPDSHQLKPSSTKKHSPHNTCHKETDVKKANQKHCSPKEVQNIKTHTADRNCSDKSSVQLQHNNGTDSYSRCRPEVSSNGLFTDLAIEKIRQKQLPKYKYGLATDFNQTDIQKADAAIDEEIRLLDEKSLQENMVKISPSSDRENAPGKDMRSILPDRTNSSNATSSSNRNKGMIHEAEESSSYQYRQLNCDYMCPTSLNKKLWLTQMSQKENDVIVSRGQHQMQTSNRHIQLVNENTGTCCLQQMSQKYRDDKAEQIGRNNAFSCDSSKPNFLFPDIELDQQKAEHDRISVHKQETNKHKHLGGVSYNASNYPKTESIKLRHMTPEKQTALGTSQNNKLPSNYANIFQNITSFENVEGHPFVDSTESPCPLLSESRNTQPQTHRHGNEDFFMPDMSNKGGRHNATSYRNTNNIFTDHTQNSHSQTCVSQCTPQSFPNSQRPPSCPAQSYENRLVSSSSPSKTHQYSCADSTSKNQSDVVSTLQFGCCVLPSSQATFVRTKPPCSTVSSSLSSPSSQETAFKMPFSVNRHTRDSNFHYNEIVQTAPCYSSVDTVSDASMCSDNSLSRIGINNTSASVTTHSCQQDLVCKEMPTSCSLQHQELHVFQQQLQVQNYSPHIHVENHTYTDAQRQNKIQCCFHQNDTDVGYQDRNDFQTHISKERMHLPCFLQSAGCDDIPCHSSKSELISSNLLHQIPSYQIPPSVQSEVLESIMTSISEKSQMSTGTSDGCFTNETQSPEQQKLNTANTGTQQASNNLANVDLNRSSPTNNSNTGPSLQQTSASLSIVTSSGTNIRSSAVSQFVENSSDLFPTLNFEDCLLLSLSSSTGMEPILTSTNPDQVLVKDGRLDDHAGISEPSLRSCKQKCVEHIPSVSAAVGPLSSTSDSQRLGHSDRNPATKEAEILSEISVLLGLEDNFTVGNKDQQTENMLEKQNK